VLVDLFLAAVVAVLALPALVLGVRGLFRREGRFSGDPGADLASRVVVVVLRVIALLLLLGSAGLTLLSTIGAAIKDVDLHGFVYVFFVLTLLLTALVLFTFGRRAPRRASPRATPARR
jgi:hypothetical protein